MYQPWRYFSNGSKDKEHAVCSILGRHPCPKGRIVPNGRDLVKGRSYLEPYETHLEDSPSIPRIDLRIKDSVLEYIAHVSSSGNVLSTCHYSKAWSVAGKPCTIEYVLFRVNSNAESLVNAPLTYVCDYFSFLALMLLSNVLASIQPTDQYS